LLHSNGPLLIHPHAVVSALFIAANSEALAELLMVSHDQGRLWPLSVLIPHLVRGGQKRELPRRYAPVGLAQPERASVSILSFSQGNP
jgi:hypothetical protein